MPEITNGKFGDGYCVKWADAKTGRQRRHRLKARTLAEAEAEGVIVYRKATYDPAPRSLRVAEVWEDYIEDLGDKPSADTMRYTGKAILPFFGAFEPPDIDKT